MKVRFVAEKGNKGSDDVEVVLEGIKNLPKFILITAEDFTTPVATGKAFIEGNELMIEADIREQEFGLYPTIGFESIIEDAGNGSVVVRESELHTVSLQPVPNNDPAIKTISEQITEGTAQLI
jgi:hypothetical protein